MSNKDLRRFAHESKKERSIWWYEKPIGFEIYTSSILPSKIKQLTISWKTIRAALARKDKKGDD